MTHSGYVVITSEFPGVHKTNLVVGNPMKVAYPSCLCNHQSIAAVQRWEYKPLATPQQSSGLGRKALWP
jgi:hypothetical protein